MGFYIGADRGVHGGKLACHRPANRFRHRLPGVSCRSRLPNGVLGLCLRVPRQVAGLPKRLLHRAGRCHARVAVVHWGTLEGPGEQVARAAIIGALSGDRQRIQAVRSRAADNGASCGGVLAHIYPRLPWRFRGNHQGACVSYLSEDWNPPQGRPA